MGSISPGRFGGHALSIPVLQGALPSKGAGGLAALHGIVHAVPDTISVAGIDTTPEPAYPVPMIPCTTAGCRRCVDRRGGYQFRWYSRHWEEVYRRTRRPDSWLPGEPEQEIDGVERAGTTTEHDGRASEANPGRERS